MTRYNAAHDLLARHAARATQAAYIEAGTGQTLSYADLERRAHAFAAGLRHQGVPRESRLFLCAPDTLDWPVVFLGSLLAGVVPVAVNTLLTRDDFDFMLRDSRAQTLVVGAGLWPAFEPLLAQHPTLRHVVVSGGAAPQGVSIPSHTVADWERAGGPERQVADTQADEAAFWLYSSGSTGTPKGTVHLHGHLVKTAELYAQPVLGIREDDVVFSAAKLFFAYGLGNALTFPLSVGATTVLLGERPTPVSVFEVLQKHRPTLFYGVPTLFAALLAHPGRPPRAAVHLRLCTSAGEALPAEIGHKWRNEYGCDILDGIGSTEMLHIFLSNRPGAVRYGSTGQAVPGYRLRLLREDGSECADGELGELQVSGPTAALYYWNQRDKTKATFCGEWTRSGDKYTRDADGYYTYGGRSDDMLKVGGIFVSPFEVEACLMTHPAVLEAAVIGVADNDGLVKPKAYVVLKPGQAVDTDTLQAHVKDRLAPYKYPRWVELVPELPKTATGKIQRFRLRAANR